MDGWMDGITEKYLRGWWTDGRKNRLYNVTVGLLAWMVYIYPDGWMVQFRYRPTSDHSRN